MEAKTSRWTGYRRRWCRRSRMGTRAAHPLTLLLVLGALGSCSAPDPASEPQVSESPDAPFMCPPCHVHEDLFFHEDGACPVCGMALIERPDSSAVGEAHMHPGSGNFLMAGAPGRESRLIQVFYHVPETFTPQSPVLIVVPGAGRNANDYRDAWVDHAERYGVLILSPMYSESDYDFAAYHMGGVMGDLNLAQSTRAEAGTNQVHLDEERFTYSVNAEPTEWIFADFDRLFELVAPAVGSERETYDLFGHSAGGQILHRLVLFRPDSRADRILAGNSGFFTFPDTAADLPFGLRDAPVSTDDLARSLRRHLVILVGAEDDRSETRGTMLRSPSADRQGIGRLERARSFHAAAEALAVQMEVPFGWQLEIVPGVGHDFAGMSDAAAAWLYGTASEPSPPGG